MHQKHTYAHTSIAFHDKTNSKTSFLFAFSFNLLSVCVLIKCDEEENASVFVVAILRRRLTNRKENLKKNE